MAVWVLFPKFFSRLRSDLWNCMKLKKYYMNLRFQRFFFLWDRVGIEDCSNLWKIIIFKHFRTLWSVSSEFWGHPGTNHPIFDQHSYIICYSWVLNCFYFPLGLKSIGRSAQTSEKWSISSIFSSLGSFPQVFGQNKERII